MHRCTPRTAAATAGIVALLTLAAGAFAQNPEPYPTPASKKGLQVQMIDDALALGIKHAALNCDLSSLVELEPQADSLRWAIDGQEYHFRARAITALDARVRPLSAAGVVVSLILLNYEPRDPALRDIFLHPSYDSAAPNRLSAFNTVTPQGARYYRAVIEFLAARYSDPAAPHGRVWNYIVGNEVNSHWAWSNMGRVTMEAFAEDHEQTVRLTHTAVRRHSENARVFLSLEHHWNIRYSALAADQSFAGRPFLEHFAQLVRERGDFDWHVAFHPYPENLFEPRFWRDKTAPPTDAAPRVTFKNLEVLLRFLARPELLHAGKPRRVILSEQGFHCRDDADGERDQAAAYALAFYKVARLEGIDAFILHRHVDHAREGGLKLGLWTHRAGTISTPHDKRLIYEVFRAADTDEWERAFAFALPIIGLTRWEDVLPRLP